jgi:hypothetical protein
MLTPKFSRLFDGTWFAFLNRLFHAPQPSRNPTVARWARAALACAATLSTVAALTTGCQDRPQVFGAPRTTNLFIDQIKQPSINKMDLLFVIDNSVSMADKQAILAKAVPALLERFINPPCVNLTDYKVSQPGPADGAPCPDGYKRDFDPIPNIHIGVITTSLGAHGGQYCDETVPVPTATGPQLNPSLNDKAHLLGTVRPGLYSYKDTGFLAWGGCGGSSEHERTDSVMLADFANMVSAAGETGCGYSVLRSTCATRGTRTMS